jgi:ABC-type uncharacterized transport system fused permease/ATPase subunit
MKSDAKIPFKEHYAKIINLLKEFFNESNERMNIFKYLIFAILSVVGLNMLNSMFSTWINIFWDALSQKDALIFLSSMKNFLKLVSLWCLANVSKSFSIEAFSIRWREWLTRKTFRNIS